VHGCDLTCCDGGDFNLIRQASEKNNDNINQDLVDRFNMFIDLLQLQEIRGSGPKYTWINKQLDHIMVTLDMVLVSTKWEDIFPLCFAWSSTRMGYDHWLGLLDSGEGSLVKQNCFYFEKQWLLEPYFIRMFSDKWSNFEKSVYSQKYSLDRWHGCLCLTKKFLRGWNKNKSMAMKKEKKEILDSLEELDTKGLDQKEPELWATRYLLEAKLDNIYLKEECYWQRRSRERWLTMGDSNTRFFHSCANRARRKTKIYSLETEDGLVTSQGDKVSILLISTRTYSAPQSTMGCIWLLGSRLIGRGLVRVTGKSWNNLTLKEKCSQPLLV
jgi:hypothetical protein